MSHGTRNATVERLILEYLREVGTANDEEISDEIERLYKRVREPVPWLDIDPTLYAMVCGRTLQRRETGWEDEYEYRLRKKKPKKNPRQLELIVRGVAEKGVRG